jgi:hypothetical protein
MRDPLKPLVLDWLVQAMADAGHAAQEASMRRDRRSAEVYAALVASRGEALGALLDSLSPDLERDRQRQARLALSTWPSFAASQARMAALAA